jgi:hypothetical protein
LGQSGVQFGIGLCADRRHAMHKLVTLILASTACTLVAGGVWALETTPDGVKGICGSNLQSGCVAGACAFGCDKMCGTGHICTYNCCAGTTCGEQGCHIHEVTKTVFGKKIKLPASAYVRMVGRSPTRASYRATGRPTYCEWCYASCPQGWGGWLCRLHCQTRGGCKPPIVRHP